MALKHHAKAHQKNTAHKKKDEQERLGYDKSPDRFQTSISQRLIKTMPAFRILNQRPVYLNLQNEPADAGHLRFYDSGTDTPKDVFGDPDLSVNNGPSILIGVDGRTVVDVWGDGSYRVRLYDADETLILEADDVELPGGAGTALPALVSGAYLTNDGAVMSWQPLNQVPDPTGSAGKILGTDGVNFLWQAPPTPPTAPITVGATNIKIGDGTSAFMIQTGTATAPASGSDSTSLAVVFPTPFTTCLGVCLTPAPGGQPSGPIVPYLSAPATATGFTAGFDPAEGGSGSGEVLNNVAFNWVAFGIVPV